MKSNKILLTVLIIFSGLVASAQTKSETFKVAGECGSCKKKIEKAAKEAGATYASWNQDSKMLTVKYNSVSSNTAKIEKSIATVGYDTPGFKATDEAYNNLDGCCQYQRNSTAKHNCCDDPNCDHSTCMKDGKCTKDMKCSHAEGDKKDCCKKS